jgi:hypothetical protein
MQEFEYLSETSWGFFKFCIGREAHRHIREDNIKVDYRQWDGKPWTGLICLGIRTGGGLL